MMTYSSPFFPYACYKEKIHWSWTYNYLLYLQCFTNENSFPLFKETIKFIYIKFFFTFSSNKRRKHQNSAVLIICKTFAIDKKTFLKKDLQIKSLVLCNTYNESISYFSTFDYELDIKLCNGIF